MCTVSPVFLSHFERIKIMFSQYYFVTISLQKNVSKLQYSINKYQ